MEFQPMLDACKRSLGGRRVALFGSYGWGAPPPTEPPDDAALEACRALGKALVE